MDLSPEGLAADVIRLRHTLEAAAAQARELAGKVPQFTELADALDALSSGTASLLLCLFLSPKFIVFLRAWAFGQNIREEGPAGHKTKAGTPTMGGLMIISGMLVSTLLWANPTNPYVWVVLWVTLGFGLVGFYDDYLKVTKQTHNAFPGRIRVLIEAAIAAIACLALVELKRRLSGNGG